MRITIDKEFKSLIPPLTADEYAGLEESILNEGCRDALVVWNGLLVDGHNRYEICTKHNTPYSTVERDFTDRNEAIEWIIKNQFGRRNLPLYERARLALRLKPIIAERAKENQRGGQGGVLLSQKSVEAKPVDTQKEIAKAAGVSHDTIAKVERIEKQAPKPVINASRSGAISINTAYQVANMEPEQKREVSERIERGEAPKTVIAEVQHKPHVMFNSGNNEWYTPSVFIEAARSVLGEIDLDPASSEIANKTVKAGLFYTAQDNGLEKPWFGNVWMNPPYSSELIGKFADKLVSELPNIEQAIVLVNNATETEWFYKMVSHASAVCFPKGRIRYNGADGKPANTPLQGQAFLYFGKNMELFKTVFREKGWVACL